MTARRSVLAVACALLVAVAGCGGDGASSADRASSLYAEGLLALYNDVDGADLDGAPWEWGVEVDDAMSKFDEALRHDPDHCGALMGSALTHVLSVLADPQLAEILTELFPERPDERSRAFLWYAQTPRLATLSSRVKMRNADFHMSVLQDYLEVTALPEFALADQRLSRFESLGCEFEVIVVLPDSLLSGREPRASERDKILSLDIDATDAHFAHAALDALQAVAHALSSYDVDMDSGQALHDLVESDADFLTLRPGGHTSHVYDEVYSLATHLIDAASSLGGETDAQEDDLFTRTGGVIELDELLEGSSVEIITELGEDVEAALMDGLTLELRELDTDAPEISVLVDLNRLLNDPLPDVRDYLPAHTWASPDSMVVTHPVEMPDPTLDGVTPGLTQQDWDGIVTWLEGE